MSPMPAILILLLMLNSIHLFVKFYFSFSAFNIA